MKQYPADTAVNKHTPAAPGAAGALCLVATPIGNLSDISERARRTLEDADFIAAEDTRVTRRLLSHLGLKKPVVSYRAHNKTTAGEQIISRIKAGERCALVTDAGTPGISDPGEDLVRLCIQNDIPVTIIPGPCAAIAALALSALPCARFAFEGFLPSGRKNRLSRLKTLENEQRTMVFYEAPHRLPKTLEDMNVVFGGQRHVSISREITKLYEQTLRLTLREACEYFTQNPPRGEFVLVVEGAGSSSFTGTGADVFDKAAGKALKYVSRGMSVRDAVDKAACETGCSGNKLYRAVTAALRR